MLKSIKAAATLGLAAFATLAASSAGAAPLPDWYGRYVWEEALGRDGGPRGDGTAIFVTRTLTLGPAAGPTGCRLNSEGYQTFEQVKCTATPEMDTVIIKLFKLRPSDPGRGVIGTRLFRMTRTGAGLVTRLEALEPTSDMTPRSGRLFRQVG